MDWWLEAIRIVMMLSPGYIAYKIFYDLPKRRRQREAEENARVLRIHRERQSRHDRRMYLLTAMSQALSTGNGIEYTRLMREYLGTDDNGSPINDPKFCNIKDDV